MWKARENPFIQNVRKALNEAKTSPWRHRISFSVGKLERKHDKREKEISFVINSHQ